MAALGKGIQHTDTWKASSFLILGATKLWMRANKANMNILTGKF